MHAPKIFIRSSSFYCLLSIVYVIFNVTSNSLQTIEFIQLEGVLHVLNWDFDSLSPGDILHDFGIWCVCLVVNCLFLSKTTPMVFSRESFKPQFCDQQCSSILPVTGVCNIGPSSFVSIVLTMIETSSAPKDDFELILCQSIGPHFAIVCCLIFTECFWWGLWFFFCRKRKFLCFLWDPFSWVRISCLFVIACLMPVSVTTRAWISFIWIIVD